MSEHEQSVDLVRRAYEAWNSRGLEALDPFAADAIELEDPPQMPDGATWRRRDAVFARLEDVAEAVGGSWVELREVRPVGDEVLVSMTWQRDDASGSPVLGDVFHVVRVRDGEIVRMRVFLSEADALDAVRSGE